MSLIALQSLRQFPAKRDSRVVGPFLESHRPAGHPHFWERALQRRQFLMTTAGTLGLMLGSDLWRPRLARAASALPNPIPGGIQPFGPGTEVFHIILPGPIAEGNEPSTITDFHGFVGIAHTTGYGTGTNTETGATSRLFFDVDTRFMKGHYIGVDGRQHNGTFSFFWLDLFESPGGTQLHSIDPGNTPGGLFWTVPFPSDSVQIALGAGTASLQASDIETKDFHDVVNDLLHGPFVTAFASFDVQWNGTTGQLFQTRNAANGFRGEFVETAATIEWSASVPADNFEFESDPAEKSHNEFAALGQEHNGTFF